jgi:CheY-like chemotaxis protein
MNGILGFAELLKDPNLTLDERQDFIRIIEKSGERMLSTLNDIVDVSKIESGMMEVNISESNINKQIEFIYNFFKPEVESKGIKFTFLNSLMSDDSIINTDIEKVYALLTNLIKNAIKFTEEGSIYFGYTLKSDRDPAELEFFVQDTGAGISLKLKEQIFERFRQGSEALDRKYEGSGLGLSICKSYVEMLNGKIWVETQERKGSTFYFTIPYNPSLKEKKEIKNHDPVMNKVIQLRKLKILVAEDDEISYLFLAITLRPVYKEILRAKTGVETVIICRNNPDIDLVLMDIKMPDMDGYEATLQIRQFNKNIIIIAQTAYALSGENEQAIAAGCNNYITKPIGKDELISLIRQYFGN